MLGLKLIQLVKGAIGETFTQNFMTLQSGKLMQSVE